MFDPGGDSLMADFRERKKEVEVVVFEVPGAVFVTVHPDMYMM